MSVSRRKFMRAGTIAALSAVIPSTSTIVFGQTTVTPVDALAKLRKSDFVRQLYTYFNIRLSKTTVLKVELYAVEEFKEGGVVVLDNFSLVFRGVHATALRQNTYRFEHTRLGKFDLFIVPAGSQGNMKFYRAVINRV
ncbi:MAG: hypothetical protein AB1631_31445 [Acidobacteriota bacterium]